MLIHVGFALSKIDEAEAKATLDFLTETITLVHGPGCPVCVIPMGRVVDGFESCPHW